MKNTKVNKLNLTAVQLHTNAVFLVDDPEKFKKKYEKFLSKHICVKNKSLMAPLTLDLDILRSKMIANEAAHRVKMLADGLIRDISKKMDSRFEEGKRQAEKALKNQVIDTEHDDPNHIE